MEQAPAYVPPVTSGEVHHQDEPSATGPQGDGLAVDGVGSRDPWRRVGRSPHGAFVEERRAAWSDHWATAAGWQVWRGSTRHRCSRGLPASSPSLVPWLAGRVSIEPAQGAAVFRVRPGPARSELTLQRHFVIIGYNTHPVDAAGDVRLVGSRGQLQHFVDEQLERQASCSASAPLTPKRVGRRAAARLNGSFLRCASVFSSS